MEYIDNEKINNIRNSVNIVDVIGTYIPLKNKGRNYFAVCPFHDDHNPSMSISTEKQIYKCFTCGATGNVFTFVQEYEHISFIEAVALVAKMAGISLDIGTKTIKKELTVDNEIMNFATKYYQNNINSNLGIEAKSYLQKRNMDDSIINEFQVGLSLAKPDDLTKVLLNKKYHIEDLTEIGLSGIGESNQYDIYINRIMFPIWDTEGNVVGFSGRIYHNEDSAKYVNSKSSRLFKKSEILYNYHRAKLETRRTKKVILVEGFMDAIRLYVNGYKNVVALMGTALTDRQIELLKQLRCEILLCLDNDTAGENASLTNGELLLKNNLEFNLIRVNEFKDPDEFITNMGIDAFKKLYDNPISFIDFKIKVLKKKYNTDDSVQLAKYVNELIPTIDNIDDDVLRNIVIKKLVNEYEVDASLFASKEKEKFVVSKIKPPTKNNKKNNKYSKASEEMLYLMMSDSKYIKIFEKRIGYFPDIDYRTLLNEIRCFYETNKYISLADFISFINDNKLVNTLANEIVLNGIDDVSDEELQNYIDIINKEVYHIRIQKLKNELENVTNINEKIEIIKKIETLKKGSVENGSRN